MCVRRLYVFGVIGLVAASPGCTEAPPVRIPETWAANPRSCPASSHLQDLEGSWLYEEQGYIYTLRLDRRGNGAYEWRNGRFLTGCLDGGRWDGRWVQAGNDREGGFRIKLSRDRSAGQGLWWYTRIGEDLAPAERGGTFQVRRIRTVSQAPGADPWIDDEPARP